MPPPGPTPFIPWILISQYEQGLYSLYPMLFEESVLRSTVP